jgi:hypothetical protein
MRKKSTTVIVALTAAGGLLAVSPGEASPLIENNIPNTNCGINAYEPSISGGKVNGSGLVDCNGQRYNLQIDACIQDKYGSTGWQTIQSSCDVNPPGGGSEYTSSLGSTPSTTESVGVWYRTWAWGWANGNTATVTSDAIYS